MNEQTENITRVSEAIAMHVRTFLDKHLHKEFHVEDLRKFVFANVKGYVAPASPDRILRSLRQKGEVNYKVVSRAKSLYVALPVKGQMTLF